MGTPTGAACGVAYHGETKFYTIQLRRLPPGSALAPGPEKIPPALKKYVRVRGFPRSSSAYSIKRRAQELPHKPNIPEKNPRWEKGCRAGLSSRTPRRFLAEMGSPTASPRGFLPSAGVKHSDPASLCAMRQVSRARHTVIGRALRICWSAMIYIYSIRAPH